MKQHLRNFCSAIQSSLTSEHIPYQDCQPKVSWHLSNLVFYSMPRQRRFLELGWCQVDLVLVVHRRCFDRRYLVFCLHCVFCRHYLCGCRGRGLGVHPCSALRWTCSWVPQHKSRESRRSFPSAILELQRVPRCLSRASFRFRVCSACLLSLQMKTTNYPTIGFKVRISQILSLYFGKFYDF